MTPTGLKHAAG